VARCAIPCGEYGGGNRASLMRAAWLLNADRTPRRALGHDPTARPGRHRSALHRLIGTAKLIRKSTANHVDAQVAA
jgi:hypothetical protein